MMTGPVCTGFSDVNREDLQGKEERVSNITNDEQI